jgi:uncharacterized membrane protein YjgN (DUF898 family)
MGKSQSFKFDGGAGGFLGTGILSFLLCVFTFGLGVPWAVVMFQSWRTRHTYVNGKQLVFLGSGAALFGNYLKWWFLCVITLGIYSFWVAPRMIQWVTENTDFESSSMPSSRVPAAV